ncbi:PREDICTED: uncharacterized protein LOC108509916 isoform X3 [Lepidothrix coronata]|uniref:Uncharacterized protein LOC108509916 isoform X3 n=1 Tax=Lepidothrix coronata TaxID=321398 RepID=A0A6J0J9Q2_9PASS|nr:PREDICTED: uncharacterized protein LOC108509916 isoform X3 [Lepidothrix coronata]
MADRDEQTPEERQDAPEERKEQAPEEREPACLLCQRSEADPDICGQKSFVLGLCVHKFCLVSCSAGSLHFLTGSPYHSLLISECVFLQFFVSNSPDCPVQRLEDWDIDKREIPDIVSQAAQQRQRPLEIVVL